MFLTNRGGFQDALSPQSAQSPDDFNRICELGFAENAPLLPRRGDLPSLDLNDQPQVPFAVEQQRDRVSVTISKVLRDRVFRRIVLRAYEERCAITGLKLINGMGRAEVAAAHIRPSRQTGRTSSAMALLFRAPHIGCLIVVSSASRTIWRY